MNLILAVVATDDPNDNIKISEQAFFLQNLPCTKSQQVVGTNIVSKLCSLAIPFGGGHCNLPLVIVNCY